ncbi:MAG: cob(I)yrinic acid a,c-diamide adenosyltransferase [Pseudomonadota bacterium]|nr:cob(I)yrinic acid a,c-diamide adenosyltransferase [Pseudomonadota bacterium]
MVKIDKVYTKGGDKGETSLGDGTRVLKTDKTILALANVEELNANIGLVVNIIPSPYKSILQQIQNDLFDVGADIVNPLNKENVLRIKENYTSNLEKEIDLILPTLPTLKSFILPGGSEVSSRIHIARTVCRRCEISILELSEEKPTNTEVMKYINRLSDLLFVIARKLNILDNNEILWKPGKTN